MDDVSNRFLSLAKVIAEAERPVRQYAIEENTFLLYSAFLSLQENGPLKKAEREELLKAWDVLSAPMQKLTFQRLDELVSQAEGSTAQKRASAMLVYRHSLRPRARNMAAPLLFAIWMYLTANLSMPLFFLSFVVMWAYLCSE